MAGAPDPLLVVPQFVGAALLALEEDEDDEEALMLQIARIAAAEIMELEEGPGFDGLAGDAWVPVTVHLDDYHLMGDPCFKLHFRMSRGVFEELSRTVYNHLDQKGRIQRERTHMIDIMLMVVWLMATPDCFRSVALRFGVRPSTLYYHYSYVIESLRELAPAYITWPDAAERNAIKGAFERATGMPGVIGCIDGTFVTITAPLQDAAPFVNRHHQHSINVQSVVDHNLLVRDLHVGEPGSMNDRRVFRRSPLHNKLLHGEGIDIVSEHLLGDGGYTLTEFVMIPFQNNGHLTQRQINFNRHLSQGRVRVENSFGLAKGKWRRLKFLHVRNNEILVDHITASFVLHNFVILNGEPMLDEEELGRRINNNQVLGNERIEEEENGGGDDEAEDEDALLEGAKARGIEKRNLLAIRCWDSEMGQ